jgi:chromate transporter
MNPVLADLITVFAQLSLLAFGGANSIIPEMQRQSVEVHHWLTATEFVSLFALAQAAPGPNMMVVSLVGWRVAGLAGAVLSTTAVATPATVLTLIVSGLWQRFRDKPWRRAIQTGLLPVTVGLVAASAALLVKAAAVDAWAFAVVAIVAAASYRTRIHPLLLLAGATIAGAVMGIG